MDSLVTRFHQSITILNRMHGAEVMKHLGPQITPTQMYMLYYVKKIEKCRITELAEKLDVKPSAVTVMIDRLEKSGYVRRLQDQTDRRVIVVELTSDGKEILESAMAKGREIIKGYMKELSDEECSIVTELLEKVAAAALQSAGRDA